GWILDLGSGGPVGEELHHLLRILRAEDVGAAVLGLLLRGLVGEEVSGVRLAILHLAVLVDAEALLRTAVRLELGHVLPFGHSAVGAGVSPSGSGFLGPAALAPSAFCSLRWARNLGLGARIMNIWRPSNLGACSITPRSLTSSATSWRSFCPISL